MRVWILAALLVFLGPRSYRAFASELGTQQFVVMDQNQRLVLDLALLKREMGANWTQQKFPHGMAARDLEFAGLPLPDFLGHIKQKLKISSIQSLIVQSADGYQKIMTPAELQDRDIFLALEGVSSTATKIYNPSLKMEVEWRPAYLIIPKSGASPYQIRLFMVNFPQEPPFLKGLSGKTRKGGQIFVHACSKCHQYQGFGGVKGPDILPFLSLYPSDSDLKRLLRNPQWDRPRQMSAFVGTEDELDSLLAFLRLLEQKNSTQRNGR